MPLFNDHTSSGLPWDIESFLQNCNRFVGGAEYEDVEAFAAIANSGHFEALRKMERYIDGIEESDAAEVVMKQVGRFIKSAVLNARTTKFATDAVDYLLNGAEDRT